MNALTPQELASLWYLKFGHAWIVRADLTDDWRDISKELMRNNLADYELISYGQAGVNEIIKLKDVNADY